MMNYNLNEHLINAASEVLSEEKNPLFKVGDEVSMYRSGSYGTGSYGRDGKVVKTNKHGHTHVDFGDIHHDTRKPFHRVFDHLGYEKKTEHVSYPSNRDKLVSKSEADEGREKMKQRQEHRDDMEHVISTVSGHRNGLGHFSKLDKTTAEHLKMLIDKHTHSE